VKAKGLVDSATRTAADGDAIGSVVPHHEGTKWRCASEFSRGIRASGF
jgi:hypothetical protein